MTGEEYTNQQLARDFEIILKSAFFYFKKCEPEITELKGAISNQKESISAYDQTNKKLPLLQELDDRELNALEILLLNSKEGAKEFFTKTLGKLSTLYVQDLYFECHLRKLNGL